MWNNDIIRSEVQCNHKSKYSIIWSRTFFSNKYITFTIDPCIYIASFMVTFISSFIGAYLIINLYMTKKNEKKWEIHTLK